MIVAGTGSRSLAALAETDFKKYRQLCDDVTAYLRSLNDSDLVVISGMAEGFDEILAFAAVELQIPLRAYIPNKGYGEYYWKKNTCSGEDRYDVFFTLLDYAKRTGEIRYVCNAIYSNSIHSNLIRNWAMVDDCDLLLVYNPVSPGTKSCYQYALSKNKPCKVFK